MMINAGSLRTYTSVLSTGTNAASAKPATPGRLDQISAMPVANQKATAATPGEKVSISDEARAALANAPTAYDAIANNPDPNISVQQYAIPDWLAATMVDVDSLPGHPNYQPGTTTAKLMDADQGDRNEYFKLMSAHFSDVMQKNGIFTQADHYNSLIADKTASDKLKQQFQQSIQSDTRLVELMQKMGVQLS